MHMAMPATIENSPMYPAIKASVVGANGVPAFVFKARPVPRQRTRSRNIAIPPQSATREIFAMFMLSSPWRSMHRWLGFAFF